MVETIRLESGHTLTGIGGSNPSLSAISTNLFQKVLMGFFTLEAAIQNIPCLTPKDSNF